jgi:membrane protein
MTRFSGLGKKILSQVYRLHIFLRRVAKEFVQDNCFLRSSSLAFSTLLALVPLTAFVFSLFTSFGTFGDVRRHIQQFLIEILVPTRTDEVLYYIEYFIENTRTLGAVGLLFFAVTSMLLLNSISLNFNALWGSAPRRGFIRTFLMYMSVLILISLLLSASFSLTYGIRRLIDNYTELSVLSRGLFRFFPSLFIFLTIWLMVYAIPTARVKLSSSAVGAAAGTIFWELARYIFIDGTNYMIRISLIYGSIAAIPIFIIWLSINWFIIFLAAEITYVHQHRHISWREHHGSIQLPAYQLLLGLRIFLFVARVFYRGAPPPTVKKLADRFAVTPNTVESITDLLVEGGLLFKTPNPNPNVIPRKDLSRTSAGEVLEALYGPVRNEEESANSRNPMLHDAESMETQPPRGNNSPSASSGEADEYSRACRLLNQSIKAGIELFKNLSILQLIEERAVKKDINDEEPFPAEP